MFWNIDRDNYVILFDITAGIIGVWQYLYSISYLMVHNSWHCCGALCLSLSQLYALLLLHNFVLQILNWLLGTFNFSVLHIADFECWLRVPYQVDFSCGIHVISFRTFQSWFLQISAILNVYLQRVPSDNELFLIVGPKHYRFAYKIYNFRCFL